MQTEGLQRGLITMALGGEKYIEMAKWLGMSLRLNAPNLPVAILTDSTDPELAEYYTHIIPHTAEYGDNMVPKFYLDRITPFQETIYIDTDCLVVNNLSRLFDTFGKQDVSILGWRYVTAADTMYDVDVPYVLNKFNLTRLPRFNGGCYYFRQSELTTKFFDTARDLLQQADTLRIGTYYGGGITDEPLFALALAICDIPLVSAGIHGMWTPINSRGAIHLDVFKGDCHFIKEGVLVEPDVVHFSAGYREAYCYHREVWRLKRHFGKATPPVSTRFSIWLEGVKWRLNRSTRDTIKDALGRGTKQPMPV